jgi:hypothetical protein
VASLSLLAGASPAAAYTSGWQGQSGQYGQYSQYQPSAPSGAGCPIPASSAVLAPLGDLANYSLLPGGDFEGSTTAWSLNGASVVPGNEPWQVGGASDSQSLSIPAGASAVSPTLCLTSQLPSWRFFAQAADGSFATKLQVTVEYADNHGNRGEVSAAKLFGGTFASWQPTSSLPLGSVLSPGTAVNVRFVFAAESSGGAWNIDDVYVDPYAR